MLMCCKVNCAAFLTNFHLLGKTEISRLHTEQLNAMKRAEEERELKKKQKLEEQETKHMLEVDFKFSDADRDNALAKLTACAIKVCCLCNELWRFMMVVQTVRQNSSYCSVLGRISSVLYGSACVQRHVATDI